MYLEQRVEELEKQVKDLLVLVKGEHKVGYTFPKIATLKKSNNQLRKEIIQAAKDYLEDAKTEHGSYIAESNYCIADFTVDYKSRTVSVKLKGVVTDIVRASASAKCLPEDTFNVHIGKAIALGKALGLDVSKFTHTIQPDDVVVGHILESIRNKGVKWEVTTIKGSKGKMTVKEHWIESCIGHIVEEDNFKDDEWIIYSDDTNAKY